MPIVIVHMSVFHLLNKYGMYINEVDVLQVHLGEIVRRSQRIFDPLLQLG